MREDRHGDFTRVSYDVVLTDMEYTLDIGKVIEKIVFHKFGSFYVQDQNRVNSKEIGIFLKFSKNRDTTQSWGFQQGVI